MSMIMHGTQACTVTAILTHSRSELLMRQNQHWYSHCSAVIVSQQ